MSLTAGELIDFLEELPQGTPVLVRFDSDLERATVKLEMARKVISGFAQYKAPGLAHKNNKQVVVIE